MEMKNPVRQFDPCLIGGIERIDFSSEFLPDFAPETLRECFAGFRFSSGTLCFNTTIMVLTSSTIKNAAQSILCRMQITNSSAHHKLTLLSGDSKVIIGRENRSEHEKTLLMKICDNHSTLDAACQPGGREKWGIRALPPPRAISCPTRPTAYASRLWG